MRPKEVNVCPGLNSTTVHCAHLLHSGHYGKITASSRFFYPLLRAEPVGNTYIIVMTIHGNTSIMKTFVTPRTKHRSFVRHTTQRMPRPCNYHLSLKIHNMLLMNNLKFVFPRKVWGRDHLVLYIFRCYVFATKCANSVYRTFPAQCPYTINHRATIWIQRPDCHVASSQHPCL